MSRSSAPPCIATTSGSWCKEGEPLKVGAGMVAVSALRSRLSAVGGLGPRRGPSARHWRWVALPAGPNRSLSFSCSHP